MREAGSFGTARNSEASLSGSDGEAFIGPPRSKRSCRRNAFPPARAALEALPAVLGVGAGEACSLDEPSSRGPPPRGAEAGVVMGVDVARFGDVASVIRFRRGRDARSILPIKHRGADTMDRGSPGAIRKEHW